MRQSLKRLPNFCQHGPNRKVVSAIRVKWCGQGHVTAKSLVTSP